MKINQSGGIEWQKGYTDGISSHFSTLVKLGENSFVTGGLYQNGGVILKIDEAGFIQEKRSYQSTNRIVSLDKASEGGLVAVSENTLILKTDGKGESCLLNDEEPQIEITDTNFVLSNLVLHLFRDYQGSFPEIIYDLPVGIYSTQAVVQNACGRK
ncbi:MAG: hypothetical protein NC911_05245 [Candidatus Omnitrophica bacterium]|nr:hypothetical protein [Candidatus Omnitrophota bacterium]